jgi:hypothetical protein
VVGLEGMHPREHKAQYRYSVELLDGSRAVFLSGRLYSVGDKLTVTARRGRITGRIFLGGPERRGRVGGRQRGRGRLPSPANSPFWRLLSWPA